jgi:uncharacterized SAM-binding protein YcdF (DUF218 family)
VAGEPAKLSGVESGWHREVVAAPPAIGRAPGLEWRYPGILPTFSWGGWWGYALLVVAVVVLHHAALFVAVWWQGTRDERQPVDAILVLGAAQWNGEPSPVLQARLDHALALYRSGYAPRLIVTGGVGEGDRYSEAGVAAAYLRAQAVPAGAILLEDQGRSSLESIRAAADVLLPYGWSRVLLVSDPPHMLRILRMARAAGLEAYGSPARNSPAVASPGASLRFMLRELILLQGYEWGLLRS